MKKKVWNKSTIPTARHQGYWITVQRSGNIQFTSDLIARLDLLKHKIEFVQDEDKPKDWYIELTNSADALEIKESKSGGGYKIQSSYLTKLIISSIGDEVVSYKIPVTVEPVERNLYAVLTKGAVAVNKQKSED